MFDQNLHFLCTKLQFDQKYLNSGLKTQNVEDISLDLIIHNNFLQNIRSFSKQISKLRIHSKPDRNQSKLTVCNVLPFSCTRLDLSYRWVFSSSHVIVEKS
jgi:hypothetical protein